MTAFVEILAVLVVLGRLLAFAQAKSIRLLRYATNLS